VDPTNGIKLTKASNPLSIGLDKSNLIDPLKIAYDVV
jgi:hypothetical protein